METLSFCEHDYNKKIVSCQDNRIEGFVQRQVHRKGLDERTEKAYRLDLKHLYEWLERQGIVIPNEKDIERYLEYLFNEKGLKHSTVTRKYRVFCYYMEYLAGQRVGTSYRQIVFPVQISQEQEKSGDEDKTDSGLSKVEIDSFFIALNKEYENLDNEFRRRVCLRDNVMMELLFYHGIEISELLKLEITDYNRKTGVLTIRGKREKERQEYLFSRELRDKMERWIGEHGNFEKGNEYDNVLFLSKIGKPLSMKMVILIFDKYRGLAGIEKEFTPKDLKCGMRRYAREVVVEKCS